MYAWRKFFENRVWGKVPTCWLGGLNSTPFSLSGKWGVGRAVGSSPHSLFSKKKQTFFKHKIHVLHVIINVLKAINAITFSKKLSSGTLLTGKIFPLSSWLTFLYQYYYICLCTAIKYNNTLNIALRMIQSYPSYSYGARSWFALGVYIYLQTRHKYNYACFVQWVCSRNVGYSLSTTYSSISCDNVIINIDTSSNQHSIREGEKKEWRACPIRN